MRAITPWQLLAARVRSDGATPFVTMYDDASGERVEVSALTFANWVAKTANLLADDLGVGPGDPVDIELPAHWQAWVIGLAVTAVGAHAGVGDPVLRVLAEGTGTPGREDLVLSLRPMGAGRLAPGPGIDYALEVRLHGDHFGGGPPAGTELVEAAQPHADRLLSLGGPSPRVLIADPAYSLEALLAPLIAGGSVVLVRHEDPSTRERRVATERVTYQG